MSRLGEGYSGRGFDIVHPGLNIHAFISIAHFLKHELRLFILQQICFFDIIGDRNSVLIENDFGFNRFWLLYAK